eukprot:3087933-Rhodomonas_salina.1
MMAGQGPGPGSDAERQPSRPGSHPLASPGRVGGSGNYNSDPEVDLELLRDEDRAGDPRPLYGGRSSRPFI